MAIAYTPPNLSGNEKSVTITFYNGEGGLHNETLLVPYVDDSIDLAKFNEDLNAIFQTVITRGESGDIVFTDPQQ